MAFVGSINADMRAMITELIPKEKGIPIYVGCSGNFTIERIVHNLGLREIHSNDVSLYSCTVGGYLAGKNVEIGIKKEEFNWLKPYLELGISSISTLLVCSDMFKFAKLKHRFDQRMWDYYKENFETLHTQTEEAIKKSLEGMSITSFTPGDCVDFIQDAPEGSVVLCFPPTYKLGYERLYKTIDEVFGWDAPRYTIFDDDRFNVLYKSMMEKGIWIISRDKEVEDLQPYLRGLVKVSRSAKPVCMYAGCGTARLTKIRTKIEGLKVGRLNGEIEGELKLIHITNGQMSLLRSEYLKASVIPTRISYTNLGVLVGDKLIGAIGFGDPLYLGNFCDAYLMVDFSIRPTIYKRLSKLVLVAALSTEVKNLLEQALVKRVQTIGTTVFSEHDISMKYRGMFELKAKREDGRLIYIAQAGQWTLKEGLEWWKKKHLQTK